jgi:ABC-2 type transport system ATP-binding protein
MCDAVRRLVLAVAPVLQVVDARKRYGATVALDGAAIELRSGEWLGLLGPNGAGKTTLVRAISGRVRLDAGTITLLGAPLDGGVGAREALGVVPQTIALYPLLSARENLECFGAMNGLVGGELRSRVAWALEITGLVDRARDVVKTFSGGMQRRLNIACGVLHRPRVVLLDEPTVGVDPQSRARIWEMLRELQSDGASLLLTTHQLDEAQELCERIVVIDGGRTIADGTFVELVERTLGRGRNVTLRLRAPLAAAPDGVEVEGAALRRRVDDVAAELPALLAAVHDAGGIVDDVIVQAPSLQAVFLALTGRELRE